MNPKRYLDYASQATEKQSRAISSAQNTTITLLWLIFLLIPLGAAVFGIFPVNPKAIQNGFVLEHWFIGGIGLMVIFILLAPFHLKNGIYGEGLVYTALSILLRIPILVFSAVIFIGITLVTFFLTTDVNLNDTNVGIAMVTVVAGIFLAFFLITYGGFIFGTEAKQKHYINPLKEAINSFIYMIHGILEEMMGTGIRTGKPTLANMILFAFLIAIYGFIIWVYFFNGWQVVDTWLWNCMCY